jgi:hypothetical protein
LKDYGEYFSRRLFSKMHDTKGKKYQKMVLLLLFIDLKDRLKQFLWDHPTMFEK